MNASDIVKAKQGRAIYRGYDGVGRVVYASTTVTTLSVVSSFLNYVSSGVPLMSTSYTSCIKTVPLYTNGRPSFLTYAEARVLRDGEDACGVRVPSDVRLRATQSTLAYAYNPVYSTLSTVSSVRVTSTLTTTAAAPLICDVTTLSRQGCNAAVPCATGCCSVCMGV